MKLPPFHRLKIDLNSEAVQTALELFAGALAFALLLRWLEA